ncbi:MAG: DUF4097 family beta strand repeat-containing protein [Candidatus Acidiferrales bacterium]|jgi:DUF4097 and DUF4098 domain-containing protein YvlB
MNRTVLSGAFLAVMTMAAGAATPAHADDWSKTYQISARADLRVSTDDGDVTIIGSDQKQIDARVTTEGYKISSSDVRIEESQNGDHVVISVKMPHFNFSFFGGKHKSVKVELHVPRELELDVETSDGDVVAQNVAGRVHFSTGDGNVTATAVHGDIRLHTGDGHISGTNFDGTLDADTGDGNLQISGRFDSLSLKTGDGNIEAQVGGGSKVANAWTVRSGDGHITMRLPADLNANVDAHTGDGSITCDIPIMVSGTLSHTVRGKLNAGGGTLSITSGDGSIHLEKL